MHLIPKLTSVVIPNFRGQTGNFGTHDVSKSPKSQLGELSDIFITLTGVSGSVRNLREGL